MLYILLIFLAIAGVFYYFRMSVPKQTYTDLLDAEMEGYPKGTSEAISHVTTMLRNQVIATCKDIPLPERAFSNYSLGYINGLLTGALDQADIDDAETAIFAMKYCYQAIFGGEHTYDLVKHTSAMFKHADDDFTDGVNDGIAEYVRYSNGDIKAPLGWIHYVFDR